MRRLQSKAIAVLSVAAIVVAGCGSSATPPAPVDPVGGVAVAFEAAKSGGVLKQYDLITCLMTGGSGNALLHMFDGFGADARAQAGVSEADLSSALKISFDDLKTTEVSRSGDTAKVHVSVKVSTDLDAGKFRELIKRYLATQGVVPDDATIDAAIQSKLGGQLKTSSTIDQDISVVQQDGKWVACGGTSGTAAGVTPIAGNTAAPTEAALATEAAPSIAPSPNDVTSATATPNEGGGATGDASDAEAIAVGSGHACALITGGGVMCWGGNWNGQLGNGNVAPNGDTTMAPPAYVLGLTGGVHAIAAEGSATCALMDNGAIRCWGNGAVGTGAKNSVPAPVDVAGLSGATGIFTGSQSFADGFCAIVAGGLKCWGQAFKSDIPVSIAGINNATSVAMASDHWCALLGNGGIKCWGNNAFGQLGNGSTTNSPTPVDVVGLTSGATAVIAGTTSRNGGFACALMANGGLKCWGANPDGTNGNSAIPADVAAFPSGIGSLAVNGGEICAIMSGGDVKCFGDSYYHPETFSSFTLKVKALALNGTAMLCALTTDDKVVCHSYTGAGGWPIVKGLVASAASGQTPPPAAAGNVSAVSLNGSGACVITTAGGAKCWGPNPGNGSSSSNVPVDVLGLASGLDAIASAPEHTCVLTNAGAVKCWGDNRYGQLGTGSTGNSLIPVDVSGLGSGVKAIFVTTNISCAITSAGGLKCWGQNDQFQLNASKTNALTPIDIPGLAGVAALALGSSSGNLSCALAAGAVKCWGAGGPTGTPPTAVPGLPSGNIALSGGSGLTCVLTGAGAVKCWNDSAGALSAAVPAPVVGLTSGAIDVAVGYAGGCALMNNGGVKCWGGNLGNGTTATSSASVDVPGLSSGVASVVTISKDTCAITTSHVLKCWGSVGTAPVDIPITGSGQ